MPEPALQHVSADGHIVVRRVLRSMTQMDALLALLAVLYFVVAQDAIAQPRAYVAVLVLYALSVLVLHRAAGLRSRPRVTFMLTAVAMVTFITSVLAFAGGDREALLNLYLLPIVTSALLLNRTATLGIVALVLAGRLTLSHFVAAHDVLTPGYGLELLAEAVPWLLVALLTNTLAGDIRDIHERLQVLADSDDITGLLNLQAFTRLVSAERERAARRDTTFAVLLVDVEGLQAVNGRHGHEAGNRALVTVAEALRRSTRAADLVARYGGDEFVLFLADAGSEAARAVANRIRHNVATTTLEASNGLQRVTVGVGAGLFPADGQELRDLINAAARAVRKDKASRRPLPGDAGAARAVEA